MQQFKYVGPARREGRFGFIETGTVINLTDHEAKSVAEDKEFQAVIPGQLEVVPPPTAADVHVELDQMSRDELLTVVAKLKEEGHTFDIKKNSPAAHIRNEILRVTGYSKNPGPEGEGEQGEGEDESNP